MARTTIVHFATEFAEQNDNTEFVIPKKFTDVDDQALAALAEQATSHFDALYGDGSDLSEEDIETLAALTEGIETINAEVAARAEKAAARAEAAAALAARVRPESTLSAETDEDESGDGDDQNEDEEEDEEEDGDATDAEQTVEDTDNAAGTVTASSKRGETRINLSTVRSRAAKRPMAPKADPKGIRDIMFAAGKNGQGIDFAEAGALVDRSLIGFNANAYAMAAKRGQHLREQNNIAVIQRPIPEDLQIRSTDQAHVMQVMDRAVDQSRLPGGSLVASGTGWCAPSEVMYDLLELESRDGLLSAPEVGVSRGGFSFTTGPLFSDIFANTGFEFTEEQDIAGEYAPGANPGDPNVVGPKPCYKVTCPEFEEVRLDVAGLCITAGLLQSRGFPEVIARTIRGALVAHDHKMSARKINAIQAGSTAVTMPAGQVGAIAPLLTSIELQAEHYRYVHRLGRSTVLEAIFPFWVRAAVRADLSRRLGVDLISVSNARIDAWFADAGINPQFVYNFQDLTGDAENMTSLPTEVTFLMYAAGTWVFGASDVITLDTIYDSVLLGTNDFTALFTEEGWLAAKRGIDSRAITVPICADGATHAGVLIDCDGTAEVAAG